MATHSDQLPPESLEAASPSFRDWLENTVNIHFGDTLLEETEVQDVRNSQALLQQDDALNEDFQGALVGLMMFGYYLATKNQQ